MLETKMEIQLSYMATEYRNGGCSITLKENEDDINNIKNNDGHAAMNGIEGQNAPL